MNHTTSGIIAEGAPMSRVRFLSEIINALLTDNDRSRTKDLLLTDEGRSVVNDWLLCCGCDPIKMSLDAKWDYIRNNDYKIFLYLSGFREGLKIK